MDPSSRSFGTSVGACGFGDIPKDSFPWFSTAAFSLSNPFSQELPSTACGACFQIECAEGGDVCKLDSAGRPLSILVLITDVCPECATQHIDVQSLSFAKMADPGIGRIAVRYRRVECNVPEDLKVSIMDWAGAGGWIRLTVDDTGGRGSVKQVYVSSADSPDSWQPMQNQWGASWELSSSPNPPLNFKFEVDSGETVESFDVVKQNGGISGGLSNPVKFSTGDQFVISDPAAQSVSAFSGGSDPMVATSDTPGNTEDGSVVASSSIAVSPVTAAPGPSTEGCTDSRPPGEYSCSQQKEFGACEADWMKNGFFCESTCGRCASSMPASSSEGSSDCVDVAPPGEYSCQQQKDFGKCADPFLANYCAVTCGRCQPSQVQAYGRKLLFQQ